MKRFKPLLLSLFIIVLDQLSKAWIVKTIPENTIGFSFFHDALEIIHVRNTAVAFSIGTGLEAPVKVLLFILVPLAVMVLLTYAVTSLWGEKEFTSMQRWCLSGIIGGGCGNLLDRIFRHFRVVDFISNKLYGFLGFDRWPTYNIADAAVVISVIFIILSMLFEKKKEV